MPSTSPFIGWIAVGINTVSAVTLVIVNKWLFSTLHWPYGALLMLIHAISTKAMTSSLACCNFVPSSNPPVKAIMKMAAINVLSVLFSTMNLIYNSFGIFQLCRILVIPATVLWQIILLNKQITREIAGSLGLTLAGIYFASPPKEVAFHSYLGFLFACLAIIFASLSAVYVSINQKTLGLNPIQLMDQQGIYLVLFYIVSLPFSMDLNNFYNSIDINNPSIPFWILVSSLCAVLTNLSGFFVIDALSPLTYQVLSHLKTISMMVLGVVYFQEIISIGQWIGIMLALSGISLYSYLSQKQTTSSSTSTSTTTGGNNSNSSGTISIAVGTKALDKENSEDNRTKKEKESEV